MPAALDLEMEYYLTSLRAVIFDLGGTLLDWPDWDEDIERRWALSYDYLVARYPENNWPSREEYVRAMRRAEKEHWDRVVTVHTSDQPKRLIRDGFHYLGLPENKRAMQLVLDGYSQAVIGWAEIFPDTVETLMLLRKRGYRLGLLSNTWWAGAWHDADLAAHGVTELLDVVAYTSDLPYSKPHPYVFHEVAKRLQVETTACVMVGDRMVDDVGGALSVGMRGVWRQNDYPWPKPEHITPSAVITTLSDLPSILEQWG